MFSGSSRKENCRANLHTSQVPPIGVDGDVAICDGGGGSLGHPIEYIKLHFTGNNDEGRTELDGICKWCGLRFYDINHPPHGGH